MDEGESRVFVVSGHFGCRCRDIMTNSPLKRAVFPLVISQESMVSLSFWVRLACMCFHQKVWMWESCEKREGNYYG